MPEAASNALIFPWLQDVTRAAQHLTRLWRAAEAEAALITRGASLWAYAGRLPRADVQALTEAIVHYWWQGERARRKGGENAGDWVRFVRLPESQKEYLLYATPLGEEMGLALVFDAATPFSQIRTQTSNLRRALAEPPATEEPAAQSVSAQVEDDPEELESENLPDEPVVEEPAELDELALSPLFSTDLVPPPTPDEPAPGNGRTASARSFLTELFASVERQGQARVVLGGRPETVSPPPESLEDDMIPISTGSRLVTVESGQVIPTGGIELSYTCALTPLLPQHALNGAQADHLAQWLPQLCLAFGWRLESVTIQNGCLVWICRLSAEVAPAYMVRTIRLQTSQRLFFEFPQLAQENPNGDFWAPANLIQATASGPVTASALQAFVAAARR